METIQVNVETFTVFRASLPQRGYLMKNIPSEVNNLT